MHDRLRGTASACGHDRYARAVSRPRPRRHRRPVDLRLPGVGNLRGHRIVRIDGCPLHGNPRHPVRHSLLAPAAQDPVRSRSLRAGILQAGRRVRRNRHEAFSRYRPDAVGAYGSAGRHLLDVALLRGEGRQRRGPRARRHRRSRLRWGQRIRGPRLDLGQRVRCPDDRCSQLRAAPQPSSRSHLGSGHGLAPDRFRRCAIAGGCRPPTSGTSS